MAEEDKYNIKIECGADFVLPFTWYDENGVPVDLTGATVEAQLREYPEAVDAYDFICTHNGVGGRITITLPSEVTAMISYSYGTYDVFANIPGVGRKQVLYGDVYVQDYVTKPIDGTMLYMIGIAKYEDLPSEGIVNRLYFCYGDRKIYRWNGQNYIATAVGNGIQKAELLRTLDDGITDIYRFTFDDGSIFDYTVINGGITSIEYTGSTGQDVDGIRDHYRINYLRGRQSDSFDFTVHNGHLTYPGIELDLESGELVMYTPVNYSGPTLELDLDSGDLMMVIGGEIEPEESEEEPEEE